MTDRAKIFAALLFLLFLFSLVIDTNVIEFIEQSRTEILNCMMVLITDAGIFLILSVIATFLIVTRRYKELLMVAAACLFALESGYIIKKLFQIPRPDHLTTQLTYATGYTFPSLHAAISFAIIPFIRRLFKKKWVEYGIVILLLSIAGSRIYLGVHYLSDILFGGLLGYLFAWTIISMEQRYEIAERFIYHVLSRREVRRQVAHLLTGLLIIILIKLNILNLTGLGAITLVGGALAIISRYKKIPFIHKLLETFERPQQMEKFPGKGSFFLVLGSFLALLLFSEPIALAAIAIMAVGDSLTTIIGIYFGKIKSPLNSMKHLEGTMLAIIAGTIAAYNFVPFQLAFFGAVVAMLFEALTIKHIDRILDDNLLIPLIAGGVMSMIL
ncbi:phosphatase PAP2 family protein [Patescibacteria group bacterium]|nr:phosphatase PAP2 family protein [Patescibacteria group bacterium]